MAAKWFNYLTIKEGPNTGLNPAWWLHHRSLARTIRAQPYLLANEWISSNIGNYLRLPIPPFALMRKSAETTRYFASLDYGKETKPCDMNEQTLCEHIPFLATGVVVFDIFIGNYDRHEGNLKVDSARLPTTAEVIDHDKTLFGECPKGGSRRLGEIDGKLGFTKPGKTENYHKIAKRLETAEHFEHWLERVECLPGSFLFDICKEAEELGLTHEEARDGTGFLTRRSRGIREIVREYKPFFPIKNWGLLLQ